MATEEKLRSVTLESSGDLSASQYFLVKVDASGQAALGGLGEVCVGVLQDKPSAAGRAAEVGTEGVSKCVASAAIAAGATVSCTAAGKAKTAATGEFVVGVARSAAAADGEVFQLMLGSTHLKA